MGKTNLHNYKKKNWENNRPITYSHVVSTGTKKKLGLITEAKAIELLMKLLDEV